MIKSRLYQLLNNKDGIAALEFALILPVLATLYFGTVEISLLVEADRRVTATSSAMADLAARTMEVDYCEVDDIFYASSQIIKPEKASDVKLRLTSIKEDSSSGQKVVEWSQARGGQSAHAKNSVIEVEDGIIPPSGSVILAEVEYKYDTLFKYIVPNTATLSKRFYLRPRQSDEVKWVGSSNNPGNC